MRAGLRWSTIRVLLFAVFGLWMLVLAWSAATPGTPPWCVVAAVATASLTGFFIGYLVLFLRLMVLAEG